MTDMNVFIPISKVDDEKRMVWGYASTKTKDSQGDIITTKAIAKALPDYMQWANIREMHRNSAVGITTEATTDTKGLYIGAKISDDQAWQKVKDKVYKGFSIGGQVTKKVGDVIEELNLIEISLVDRPANAECKIDVVKVAEANAEKVDAPINVIEDDTLTAPQRNQLIEKFLTMGAALLGIKKDDAITPTSAHDKNKKKLPQNDEQATLKSEDDEDDEDEDDEEKIMAGVDLQKEAAALGISVEELQKRLGARVIADTQKAVKMVRKAQALHAKAVSTLSKAAEAAPLLDLLSKLGDALDLTEMHITKAGQGMAPQADWGPNNTYFRPISQSELTEGSVEDTGMFGTNSRFNGQGGNQPTFASASAGDVLKAAIAEALKPLQDQMHKVEIENATLKGQTMALAAMPGNARKGSLYAVDKSSAIALIGDVADEGAAVNTRIAKAYSEIDHDDPQSAIRAAARIIGERTLAPSHFGKSITDPGYKGGAGR